jgi:acyl-CoA synthetase (AMP-forming)/AMP-acid ligase II
LAEKPLRTLLQDDLEAWSAQSILERGEDLGGFLGKISAPGSFVGVCFPNWAVQSYAIIAVIRSGRIPVLVNFADAATQFSNWMTENHFTTLLTSEDLVLPPQRQMSILRLARDGKILRATLATNGLSLELLGQAPTTSEPAAPPGTLLVLYTSGSTGKSKRIFIPEAGVTKTVDFLVPYFGLSAETIAPIVLPVCHSMALNTQFFPTLLSGGRCYFVNSRLSYSKIYRNILACEGTFVSLIGEVLKSCWEEKNKRQLPAADQVKHIQLAGGVISPRHLEMAREIFPNARIHKGYGLTEAIRVTMIDDTHPQFHGPIVGHPLPFQKVDIRDPAGNTLPPLQTGEICVQGPCVTPGVFENDILKTGDQGYLDAEGLLAVTGRLDSVFKINGLKVSGHEIEHAAMKISNHVQNAKSVMVEDQRRGRPKVVLFLEMNLDLQPAFVAEEFATFRERLARELKLLGPVCRDILLLGRFPRTSNGKLSLIGLKTIWEKLDPDGEEENLSLVVDRHSHFRFIRTPHEVEKLVATL